MQPYFTYYMTRIERSMPHTKTDSNWTIAEIYGIVILIEVDHLEDQETLTSPDHHIKIIAPDFIFFYSPPLCHMLDGKVNDRV